VEQYVSYHPTPSQRRRVKFHIFTANTVREVTVCVTNFCTDFNIDIYSLCLLFVNIPDLCYREFCLRRPRGEIILIKEMAEVEFVMDPRYMPPEELRKSGLKTAKFF